MRERPPKRTGGRLGRPPEFDRDESIRAAMDLIWSKGFLTVSISDLADAMSIKRSSFYNSFDSRANVFRDALKLYASQTPDIPLESVEAGQPVVPLLVSVFHEICRVRAADREGRGCMVCNAVAELVGVDDEIGPLIAEAINRRVATLERLIRQAAAQGEIEPPSDIPAAARALVAFLVGLNTISKVIRKEDALWSMCRQILSGVGVPRETLVPSDSEKSVRLAL